MPSRYQIIPDRRLVFSTITGGFTIDDFTRQTALLRVDPQFVPEYDHLVDCRGTESMTFTGEQVRTIAGRSAFADTSRRAFVVPSDLHFGLARMLVAYRRAYNQHDNEAFREMSEALTWLGLPPDFGPPDSEPAGSDSLAT